MKEIILKYPFKRYPVEVIRYAAYTLTPDFWILISRSNSSIEIRLTPKKAQKLNEKNIKKRFEEEIKDELIRQNLMNINQEFRFNIIKKAITYTPPSEDDISDALTPEEQKELEKLIKEAEEEIKKELMKEKENDIRKTWEEKYGKTNR